MMKVNTTVTIFNPNPPGAKLPKVVFDVVYFNDTQNYPGHERTDQYFGNK
jgi:hypothetical protein